jgi:hypothetical protein
MLPNCDRLAQSRSEPENFLESAIAFCWATQYLQLNLTSI